MKIFSTREWVIGSVVVIAALSLAIYQVFRIVELDRREASRNNLLHFHLAFTMYAQIDSEKTGGNPKGLYPALSSEPGILQMDADTGVRVVQAFDFDVDIFVSPAHPRWRALLRQAKADPASAVTDESYWYLGYALPDEERGMAFVDWYREQASLGSIPSPSVIERGDVRIRRLRDEIDSRLFQDDIESSKIERPKGDNTRPPSTVPVLIERPGLFDGGGHVTYADGGTFFRPYPGEYPMTREFIEGLESLGEFAR